MADTPKTIWLQDDPVTGETTWCEDKIYDDDVEYIRAPDDDEGSNDG